MLQLYVNYPKITTLDNFNKFQIPSTAIVNWSRLGQVQEVNGQSNNVDT